MIDMGDLRWASVSRDMSETVSTARHLVPKLTAARKLAGWITSVCGATANATEIWRGNTTKPVCKACLNNAPLMRADREDNA